MAKHYYLVDSENVNDNWLLLLDLVEPEDRMLIFYTVKSPHMSYPNMVKLLSANHELEFIECIEGANALDFQLVSQLGFFLCEDPDADYSIMTNDTGFDAVVDYWKKRDYSINRINVNYCKSLIKRKQLAKREIKLEQVLDFEETIAREVKPISIEKKEDVVLQEVAVSEVLLKDIVDGVVDSVSEESVDEIPEAVSSEVFETAEDNNSFDEVPEELSKDVPEELSDDVLEAVPNDVLDDIPDDTFDNAFIDETEEKTKEPTYQFDKKEVDTLIACVSKNDLAKIHNVLTQIYGSAEGKKIYKVIKAKSYVVASKNLNKKKKVNMYCMVVFNNSEFKGKAPADFADFLLKNEDKCKNLNSIRPAILKQYGETDGMKYYSLFKPHIKTIITL